MIHVLTGDGAGKTTSSIGHLIRAIGNGGRGLIIQFYKNDRNAGDYRFFFEKHPSANVDIIQYGVRCLRPEMRKEQKCFLCGECMKDKKLLRRRVLSAIKKVKEGAKYYDSIVLDEILVAYSFGHISEDEIRDIVSTAPEKEWYLTGRLFYRDRKGKYHLVNGYVPRWLYDLADYIIQIEQIKHPFNRGVKARLGVEW